MSFPFSWRHAILAVLLVLTSGQPTGAKSLSSLSALAPFHPRSQAQVTTTRRVNAPHFDGNVRSSETAIFWFGQVTDTENSVDVRVGYNDDHLYLRATAFDRRLWYDDTSPSPDDLTAWDAVTLYLDTAGNLGDAPSANTYRFDAQLVWWERRDDYQAAYVGDGSDWVATTMPFTTTSGWRGTIPNSNEEDDRGWWLAYQVTFESLGLSQPPSEGTVWGLALTLHDRDDAGGTPITDKVWPETMNPGQPNTWGQLVFGTPTYSPQSAVPGATMTMRQGMDEIVVVDGAVGGGDNCGEGLDYWTEWGETNYAGLDHSNVQNQGDVADWPCFSKYYVTFPLDTLPSSKVIISAMLTLHQFGNAGEGWDPGPQPSLIQVLTISEEWDEATLTWNNAPLAQENVAAAWVDPVDTYPGLPGIPWQWDVSGAAAEAYAEGTPLRLALYEADFAYHSGKYFHSSDTDFWNEEGRPTLTVTWGHAVAELEKSAVPPFDDQGSAITFTLSLLGSGNALALTDTLPIGLRWDDNLELSGTNVTPVFDSDGHRLTWSDTPSLGQQVFISYVTTITTSHRQALVSITELTEVGGDIGTITATVTTTVFANPALIFLPLVFKEG